VACQFNVTGSVQEKVLWLENAVSYSAAVQVIERLNNTESVEARCVVIKVVLVSQNCPQITAKTQLQQL
jgi:hypothetical protein